MNDDFFDNIEEYKNNKRVKCANCGREVKDLEKGCPNCNNSKEYSTENYNPKIENIMKEQNTLASFLEVIFYFGIVFVFILSIFLGRDTYGDFDILLFLKFCITYGSIFFGVYILAEIIQILHDIRLKLWADKKK